MDSPVNDPVHDVYDVSLSSTPVTPVSQPQPQQQPQPQRQRQSMTKKKTGVRLVPWRIFQTITSSVRKSARNVKSGRRHRLGRKVLNKRTIIRDQDYYQRKRRGGGGGDQDYGSHGDGDSDSDDDNNHHDDDDEKGDGIMGELSPLLLSSSRMSNRSEASQQSSSVEVENILQVSSSRYSDSVQGQVLNHLERFFRYILFFLGIYFMGWKQSISFLTPNVVWSALYLIGIAWGTCILIQVISWSLTCYLVIDSRPCVEEEEEEEVGRGHGRGRHDGSRVGCMDCRNGGKMMTHDIKRKNLLESVEDVVADHDDDDDEGISLVDDEMVLSLSSRDYKYNSMQPNETQRHSVTLPPQSKRRRSSSSCSSSYLNTRGKVLGSQTPKLGNRHHPKLMNEKNCEDSNIDMESGEVSENGLDDDDGDSPTKLLPPVVCDQVVPVPKQHHPELEDVYIMDLLSGNRIVPGEPYQLDCEMFHGTLLVMCRTSDADSSKPKPGDVLGTELNTKYSDYFRNKQRRFEIQLQIKFKKAPPSRLFFHCQVDEPIKLGVVQRAFVAATLNLIEKKNFGGFVYNVPGKEPKPDELLEGKYEKPHITFAAEKAFDRLVVTKEGEDPPRLGTEIYEDPEAMKYRRKHEFSYNTSDTYTFALWSAYGDFTRWKCVNLPAIGPFSFSSIIRDQNFSLHLYYLDAPDGENRHMERYQRRLASFEMNHAKYCKMSEARNKWMLRNEATLSEDNAQHRASLAIQVPSDAIHIEDESVTEKNESRIYLSESEASGSEYDDQYSYDDDEETRALEELGEGIYLRSGDAIQLREFNARGMGSILTNGGGFATLQSDNNATIIIEKIRPRSRALSSTQSQASYLIRNGDVVILKMIDDSCHSYLTIHKGWWLKWIQNPSRNSCLFTIHTNDVEEDISSDSSSDPIELETQSSYLRLGGTFRLRSQMTALDVGVRVSDSVKYGGRVLGLYKPGSHYVTESQGTANRSDSYSIKQMMMPLKLCAYVPNFTTDMTSLYAPAANLSPVSAKNERRVDDFSIDASAWLEVMHRSKRHVFRVYAVRMLHRSSSNFMESNSSLRLRTGKELTPLLQFGALYGKQGRRVTSPGTDDRCHTNEKIFDISSSILPNLQVPDEVGLIESTSVVTESNHNSPDRQRDHSLSQSSSSDDSDSDEETGLESPRSMSNYKRTQSKAWIRSTTYGITKVAKGVKTGTIKSGHLIGKAVSHKIINHSLHHKRRYLREKQRKASVKGRQKDHHIAVNKALKTAQLSPRLMTTPITLQMPNGILAGQLKAPDQSCRTVSYILSTLSSEPSAQAKALLSSHLLASSDVDLSFLSGGAIELGVDVSPTEYGKPRKEFVVARALWDSHWREEVLMLFDSSISFYTPLSKKSDLSIPFYDIQGVRQIEDNTCRCPLTGFPLLAIETAWKCHYIAFRTEEILNEFLNRVNSQIFPHHDNMPKKDEWNARMWQNIQSSTDTSGESAKWASIISSKKRKQRIILNSRRMPFDCEQFSFCDNNEEFQLSLCSFVESLLCKALSFSLENLMKNPSAFVQFLDDTSRLRVLPLRYMDKSDKSSFCIYVNIYHCLLQHSLLLCTGGPPTKKNVAHFMRTHCYEIGGDIFSLAELESYVIRGNLPNPYYPRAPYGSAPKKSRGHVVYALEYVDPRLPFILHYGNTCHPPDITVFSPSILEEQLSGLSRRFLQRHIKVDKTKRLLILPKVCDIYRNDFGDTRACIDFCLQYLNEEDKTMLIDLLQQYPNLLTVKYGAHCNKFHPSLKGNRTINAVAMKEETA